MRRVEAGPSAQCKKLAATPLLALPAASEWARTVNASVLLEEAGVCGQEAVSRVSASLRRWVPVDPAGWTLGARAALVAGRIDEGRSLLDQALRRDPTSPYLHRLMALLDIHAGKYDRALELLADAEGLAPGYRVPPVEVLPGDDMWIRLEGLKRRARLYPRKREDSLLRLANILWSMGERDRARKLLEPIEDRPNVIMALANWALREGKPDDAVRLARSVAERTVYPRKLRSQAYSVLARALEAQWKTDEAMEVAKKALKVDPGSPDPYVALARLARRRGDTKTALRYIRSAWGVAPADVRVLLEVANIADAAGAVADARLALERAEKLAPDDPSVGLRLADFLLRHGELMQAAMVLSGQLKRHPMNPRLIALATKLQRETTVRR
jgi:tetratricopeptide (TPR) repeat protein